MLLIGSSLNGVTPSVTRLLLLIQKQQLKVEKRLQLLSVITKVYSLHFTNGNGKTNCGRHATIGTMASNYALARATLVTEEL